MQTAASISPMVAENKVDDDDELLYYVMIYRCEQSRRLRLTEAGTNWGSAYKLWPEPEWSHSEHSCPQSAAAAGRQICGYLIKFSKLQKHSFSFSSVPVANSVFAEECSYFSQKIG